MRFGLAIGSCLIVAMLASGCAVKPAVPKEQRSAADPWEPLNRQIHGFNNGLDKVTFKPLAKGYRFLFPQFLRTGIRNFSTNLRAPAHSLNNLLQGKGKNSLSELGRFLANSTFGLLGVLDVATDMGLEKHPEDFGQTFAAWGIPDGPFVTVPILGPRTLRGAFAIPLNILADPLLYYDNSSVRDRLWFIRVIDLREKLFAAEALLKGSQDRYISIREAYLQNRLYLIYDGDPPVDEDLYEDFDDDEG
jgi:phospholipid-binding lipoprotein MlaA